MGSNPIQDAKYKYSMQNFNALVLVDCWGEEWIKQTGSSHSRGFYGRVIDFAEQFKNRRVYFWSQAPIPTHHWLEEFYLNHVYVSDASNLTNRLPTNSTILLGGAAWGMCVHGAISELQKYYKIYSHPQIVCSPVEYHREITQSDFEQDGLSWIKDQDFFYLNQITSTQC